MELVYLWVEKYKNIEKQGFNFSPKFRCEFKPVYKENGELDEEKSELVIKEREYTSIFPENINITAIVGKNGSGKSSLLELISNYENIKKNVKYFLVINIQNKNYIFFHNIEIKTSLKSLPYEKELHNRIIHLDYSQFVNPFYSENISTLIDFTPEKEDRIRNEKEKLFFKIYNDFNLIFLLNFNILEKINIIDYPNTLYFKININDNLDNIYNNLDGSINSILYTLYSIIGFYGEEENIKKLNDFKEELSEKENAIIRKVASFISGKVILDNKNLNILNDFVEMLMDKDVELITYFDFYLLDKENNQLSFSNGEKILFMYLFYLNRLDKKLLIIDEIDLYLHPQMLKRIVNIFVNSNTSNSHIIFTTHSPFIISDLPKENIIFLDKDENGKCKVVDGLNEKKETFGANIHTLLSDSFFMEDGFIGKFAESEIKKVINYLNGKKSKIKTDKEAQKIINIIGEPIIKKELQKRLDSKRLGKVSEIDKVKREMRMLKNRLKELERLLNEKDNNNG